MDENDPRNCHCNGDGIIRCDFDDITLCTDCAKGRAMRASLVKKFEAKHATARCGKESQP